MRPFPACAGSILVALTALTATGANLAAAPAGAGRSAPPLHFVDASEQLGLGARHAFDGSFSSIGMAAWASGGMAAGDINGDGFVDLILVRGDVGPPLLLENRGDGSFRARQNALAELGARTMGPTLGDFDGDGTLDLIAGAIKSGQPAFLLGNGRGGFRDVSARSAVHSIKNTFSSALGDIDRDGDLDLALTHWDTDCRASCGSDHLWENVGGGRFQHRQQWDLGGYEEEDFSFTPNFADINSDGWPDLLIAADLRTSRVLLNRGGTHFEEITDRRVITDSYGMGSAVGDYDNDGDLDWFVTSSEGHDSPDDGNMLYRNRGDGTFDNVTRRARVGRGGWGWGACFADFNNDGWLDLFHTNGWYERRDSSKLFMNRGNGRFRESAAAYGLEDTGSGRGVSCFDYDRDGDVDILVANHNGPARLYRNDGGNGAAYLGVRLRNEGANSAGVGARIYVSANGMTQVRELQCGSNYVSQNPVEAHFGLAGAARARVRIVWPDGIKQDLGKVAAGQLLTINRRR